MHVDSHKYRTARLCIWYMHGKARNGTRYHGAASQLCHFPISVPQIEDSCRQCILLFGCHNFNDSSRLKLNPLGTIFSTLVHAWGVAQDFRALASRGRYNINNRSLSVTAAQASVYFSWTQLWSLRGRLSSYQYFLALMLLPTLEACIYCLTFWGRGIMVWLLLV